MVLGTNVLMIENVPEPLNGVGASYVFLYHRNFHISYDSPDHSRRIDIDDLSHIMVLPVDRAIGTEAHE